MMRITTSNYSFKTRNKRLKFSTTENIIRYEQKNKRDDRSIYFLIEHRYLNFIFGSMKCFFLQSKKKNKIYKRAEK